MKNYNNTPLTKEQIEEAINATKSMISAAKYLNISRDKFKKYAKLYGLYKPNQSGKNMKKSRIYSNDEIFSNRNCTVSSSILIKRLKEIREWRCECCGATNWMGELLPLEIHHIDGNRCNNELSNLQILCPNCHSLTTNWRSRNIKGYSKKTPKVSDSQLLQALAQNDNIFSALQSLGLAGGSNYKRVYNLLLDNVKNSKLSNK